MSELAGRYQGEIVTVNPEGFGFIGIGTVTRENSLPHDLPTESDIFLHREDAGLDLKVGKRAGFTVVPDKRREGCFRAMGAVEVVDAEVLPPLGPVVPGFMINASEAETHLAIRDQLPIYGGLMKAVPRETVERVVDNGPLASVPRINAGLSEQDAAAFLSGIMSVMFQRLSTYGASFSLDDDDKVLQENFQAAKADMAEMGMEDQIRETALEIDRYRDVKSLLTELRERGFVRPTTIIPIKFLPDLFMAAPVWFMTLDRDGKKAAEHNWTEEDPRVHPIVLEFCRLFPNDRWGDLFQMFNRRVRTLATYKGDIIPPKITKLILDAQRWLDTVVIATPYHDIAGKDWEDLEWLRSIDPYVLGFKKGFPFFFVLGRYSDSGVFPLYHEMVADTIEFLRTNKSKLNGFRQVQNPWWYTPIAPEGAVDRLANRLQGRVDELLAAFDSGCLFSWLRGEDIKKEGSAIERQ